MSLNSSSALPRSEALPPRSVFANVIVAVLVLAPLLSLAINALAWLRYGIDLPYADDWRTYQNGTAYSLDPRILFTPANDTLFPVGRILDVLAMRYLAGNSVAYQALSMVAVLGGFLALQWCLLRRVLRDPVLAAAAFSLTLFMLQPDTYWGLQNLAYHQAIPLLCSLAILVVVTGDGRQPLVFVPILLVLGFASGMTYISGAFATLALAAVVLAFAGFSPIERRFHARAGLALAVPGLVCTVAQLWTVLAAQKGQISAKVAWALPYERDFWAYMLGKFGRALLLPANAPGFSLLVTVMVLCLVGAIAAGFLVRLLAKGFQDRREASAALVFLSLLAVVFVYMLLVAAGRANLRPETVATFLDIFAFGFLRFHFFWATALWPWVAAAVFLWFERRGSPSAALVFVFFVPVLVLPAVVWQQGFAHGEVYRARMAYRMENEVDCLEAELQKGGTIVCPVMIGSARDLRPAYDFARRHDASFTRYFADIRSEAPKLPKPLEQGPTLVDNVPAGEIVRGTSIVQTVLLASDERRDLMAGDVCLRLFLANYARENNGQADVELRLGDRSWRFLLPFASVRDNQFHELCGPGVVQPGNDGTEATIRIDGVDGEPSHAVTAWLSKDTSRGTARVDGRETGRSLVFTLAPSSGYGLGETGGAVLAVLGAAGLALCFVGAARERRARPA